MANNKIPDFPDWQRICFDKDIEIAGVKGRCEAPDCDIRYQGCKVRQLIEVGHIKQSDLNKSYTLMQHTCGVPEQPLWTQKDNMTEFFVEMKRKFPDEYGK